ncbi:hypothetical protein AVEN_246694-1 [Araneus ventricosus]|uniref:Uncharacterized protein n=1 Tax=Araneus ventricosus TaxID=182803 RepID=A0A4Y2SV47_ARAVE|nr:hypothetical protein AVEN_246694-1 [Araneus ventricosus]
MAQWLASPLRNRQVAYDKLAASSCHGDFEAFVNLLQACTLVMTNLWQACCKLKLLSGSALLLSYLAKRSQPNWGARIGPLEK